MSGRPRSRMTRSGFCSSSSSAVLPFGRVENLVALRGKAHAQQLADRRLVVDDQDLQRRGAHAAVSSFFAAAGIGSRMVNTAPLRSVRFAAVDRAVHRLDEAARDGEPEAGAGAHLVALGDAMELVEDALEIGGRNAVAFVEDLQLRRSPPSRQPWMRMVDPSGAYFAALSRMLNSACSNRTASTSSIGRSAAIIELDAVAGEDLAGAPQRAADDLAEVVRRGVGRRARRIRAWSCRGGWR